MFYNFVKKYILKPSLSVSVYDIAPVWGELILTGVTLLTRTATAPYTAALEAPYDLYYTVVE